MIFILLKIKLDNYKIYNVFAFTQVSVYHQVKRVLKSGGKFIGLTLAESYVLGMVIQNF